MKKLFAAVALSASVFLATAPVAAHHAFAAEFDDKKPVVLKGKVTMVEWVNPHTWIHMDVTGPNGKVVNWKVEGGAPNALYRRGWNKTSVTIGSMITVDGFLAKDGTPTANARTVTLPDGRVVGAASSNGNAAADN